jgi:hypothetical protein
VLDAVQEALDVEGLHSTALRSSPAAPVNSLSTSAPSLRRACRTVTYSLALRFMPSMSGVTIRAAAEA